MEIKRSFRGRLLRVIRSPLQKIFPIPEHMRKPIDPSIVEDFGLKQKFVMCKNNKTHKPIIFPVSEISLFHVSQLIKNVLFMKYNILCLDCDQVYKVDKTIKIPEVWQLQPGIDPNQYPCVNNTKEHDVVILKDENNNIFSYTLTQHGMYLIMGIHCNKCRTTIKRYSRQIIFPSIWENLS